MIAVSSEVIHPVERFKVSKLTKHPNNPRILRDAQYQTLKKSIEDNPDLLEARPLILSNRTGKNIVIGGNQRLQVVKDLGWLTVPCVLFPDLTEEKEREIMIRDNVSNGDWDFDKLKADWDSTELNEWGLDVPWGDAEPDQVVGQTDADETPEVQPVPVSLTGDLWVLGDHRLLCGDSTDADQVATLMNGEKADMVFTDPPYGVNYEGGHFHSGNVNIKRKREKLAHDDCASIYTKIIPIICKFADGPCYTWYAASKATPLYQAIDEYGEFHAMIVWHKINAKYAAMNAQYKQRHEPCAYWKPKGSTLRWCGPSDERTVWEEKRDAQNTFHPTQKPTCLAERAIGNHTAKTILDLFGGSGSTMIACEKTGRHCRMMELDQNYCDVIIRRWQDFTGRQAILESTGQTFEEVKNERIS